MRINVKHYYTESGARLFSLNELAAISDVPVGLLRSWFNAGDMVLFFTGYQVGANRVYYRIGRPTEKDELLYGHIYRYKPWKGGPLCESPNNQELEIPLQSLESLIEN